MKGRSDYLKSKESSESILMGSLLILMGICSIWSKIAQNEPKIVKFCIESAEKMHLMRKI